MLTKCNSVSHLRRPINAYTEEFPPFLEPHPSQKWFPSWLGNWDNVPWYYWKQSVTYVRMSRDVVAYSEQYG